MALGGGRLRPKILPRRIIFFHILPRLPVSSLQRCRTVCKQWHSFLKSRFFANMHNRHLTNGSSLEVRPKLLFLSTEKPFEFRIIDFEAPDDGSISRRHYLPFVPVNARYIHALTSLHGLVCLSISNKDYRDKDLMLWNPLTGEHKTLSRTNNPYSKGYFPNSMTSGLYYNASDDDYKLFTLLSYDLGVYIYSLKYDSWRYVDSTENYQTLSHFKCTHYFDWGFSNGGGTWLNGSLYFLYAQKKRPWSSDKKKQPFIIKFDTKIEKFTVIPTHPSLMDLDVEHLSMNVEDGHIHLGVKYETSRHVYSTNAYIQMWRMIGDNGNWEKVGCQYRIDNSLEPLHWIGNKTWLMIKDKKDMYKVDHSKGICITNNYMTAKLEYRYMIAALKYTESFMSLDRSI